MLQDLRVTRIEMSKTFSMEAVCRSISLQRIPLLPPSLTTYGARAMKLTMVAASPSTVWVEIKG